MKKKSALFAVLAVLAACAAPQDKGKTLPPGSVITKVPTDLRVEVPDEGLRVTADLQLPWEASAPKSADGQTSFQMGLKEPGAGMSMTFFAADRAPPFPVISMVRATLELNNMTVSPIGMPNAPGSMVLKVTFSGTSKEIGPFKGQATAWIVPGTKKSVLLFGSWPEKMDAQASADFDAVGRGVTVAMKK